MKTFFLNYNGKTVYVRVYSEIRVTVENASRQFATELSPVAYDLGIPSGIWGIGSNRNGIYFQAEAGDYSEELIAKLEGLGFTKGAGSPL